MSDEPRLYYLGQEMGYLSVMNTTRFPEVWPPLKKMVTGPGEFAYSWNGVEKELAGCTWLPHGVGKKQKHKCILTNAFALETRPKEEPKSYIIGEFYKKVMRADDDLNAYLATKWYPYKRRLGYIENLDDFTWTALLWNCYALFHETYEDAGPDEWETCLMELAKDLWTYATELYVHDHTYRTQRY